MKIFLDNVTINSSSGPNGFAKKISEEFVKKHEVYTSVYQLMNDKVNPDVQLSFIASECKLAPIIQRLDGIYFNSEQDFMSLNSPIEATYNEADAVIFQSRFNKKLTESFFGQRENSHVISNGTNISLMNDIIPMRAPNLNRFKKVWCCASSWRPHKRLKENIRYFKEYSKNNECLVIAGENPDVHEHDDRIFYAGHLSWLDLISLMKRSSYFLHLSWLDHCPNVVIDARAAGCQIICSSSGGTSEIAGKDAVIIQEDEWDFSPTKLYSPPDMDFTIREAGKISPSYDIADVAESYLSVISGVV